MELEMAIRGYQRICTLQSAATPARCREACPSSQCRARRARTMRPTWGNTRTHVSDDITRPSPRPPKRPFVLAKCAGTHAAQSRCFLETTEEERKHQERFRAESFFFPQKRRIKNLSCTTGSETERSSLFSTKKTLVFHPATLILFSSIASLYRSFSISSSPSLHF